MAFKRNPSGVILVISMFIGSLVLVFSGLFLVEIVITKKALASKKVKVDGNGNGFEGLFAIIFVNAQYEALIASAILGFIAGALQIIHGAVVVICIIVGKFPVGGSMGTMGPFIFYFFCTVVPFSIGIHREWADMMSYFGPEYKFLKQSTPFLFLCGMDWSYCLVALLISYFFIEK